MAYFTEMGNVEKGAIRRRARRRFLFMPLKRFLPYMGFVLAILIIVSQQTIWGYTERIVGKLLVDIVRFETRGKYTISYEKVRFSIMNDQLFLTNFSVEEVDHLVVLDSTKQPNFSLKSTGLSIDVNSVFDMLINQTIELEGLEIINPQLNVLVDHRNLDKKPETLSFDKVFELVTKYLDDFNIRQLKIEHAELNFVKLREDTTITFKLKDVSLNLEHYVVFNPLDHGEEPTVVNHFNFELLEDSLSIIPGYLLTFKKFTGSSNDSLIVVEDLALIPNMNSDQNLKLDLEFPKIIFSDLRLEDILRNREINSGHLKIEKGDINIRIKNLDRQDSRKNFSLIPISLDGIEIADTKLDISFLDDEITGNMQMTGTTLTTGGISIPDPSNINLSQILKTLNLNLEIRQYYIDLRGIDHTGHAENITFNQQQGYISVDNINLLPRTRRQGSYYATKLGSFQAWGVNTTDAIFSKRLKARKILLRGINLDIRHFGRTQISQDINYRNIYPLVKQFYTDVEIGEIQFSDLNLIYENPVSKVFLELENYYLQINDLKLDSLLANNSEQLLGARELALQGDKFHLKVQNGANEVNLDKFSISTAKENLDITNFSAISYFPDRRTISSDLIHLSGIDWYSMMHGKGIVMDTMFISNPKIFINKLDSVYIPSDSIILTSSPAFLDSASIKHIHIKNGEIDIRNINDLRLKIGEIVTRIDDFKVAKRGERIQWTSDFFYAENGPFFIELNQINHLITGKKITISKSDSTLRLNQFKVRPIGDQGAINKINISVPNIVFTGIDLTFLLDSSLISTRNIHIINPSFDMDFTGLDEFEIPENSEQNTNIASNFRFVSDKISLSNSNLEIKYIAQNEERRVGTSKLDMDIFGIHFDPETPVNKELLFLDRIEINTEDVSHSSIALLDTIYIKSLNLNTDKYLKISNLYTLGRNDQVDFNTTIEELEIQSPGWFEKILNKDFHFDSISVTKPDLYLSILSSESDGGLSLEDFADSINNNPFSIHNINITSGSFNIISDGKNFTVPSFHANIHDLSSAKELQNFFSEDISLTFEGLKDLMPESTGYLDIDKLQVSTGENSIRLEGFSYNPKYSKLDFGREIGYQTDWLNIQSRSMDISGIDLWRLIKHQELIIENVLVDSTNIYAYRDKNIPFPIDQVRYMPQKSIASIEFPLSIESIVVNNMNITYEELSEGANQAGIIDFQDLTGGISNITNDSSKLATNHIMTAAINCYILSEGNLQADFEFDLTDPNGKHSYKAFLTDEMSLLLLNKMLEPSVNVHISSGIAKKLKMEVEGNADYITGEMDFLYNDLHFNLISKKTGTTSAFGPALGSFFANTFIVRTNNPNPLLVRGGDVYAERDTTKAFFNYITKTALSGIVSSIGARNNRKLIKRANKEAQEKQERKKKKNRVEPNKVITSKKDD